jgi:hypothetical protein
MRSTEANWRFLIWPTIRERIKAVHGVVRDVDALHADDIASKCSPHY